MAASKEDTFHKKRIPQKMNEQLLNRPLAQGKVVGRGRGGGEGVVASTTRVHPRFEVILAR